VSKVPTGKAKKDKDGRSILVISLDADMARTFIQSVCGTTNGPSQTQVGNETLRFETSDHPPLPAPVGESTPKKLDGILLLVRMLDSLSIDRVKDIYRNLPSDKVTPLSIVICREMGEVEFKISCPACGQKLWVRDADVGRRGRCPQCKKAFVLPSQANHLKSQLLLPDAVHIVNVILTHNSSCRGVVAGLMERVDALEQVSKASTVRVQVTDVERKSM
jgi:hypothetical protein